MRILFLGLNFWPEPTGIGKYSGEMVNYLQEAGHQVTVITTPPYYPQWKVQPPYSSHKGFWRETWHGAEVIRCPLYVPTSVSVLKRIVHLLSFRVTSRAMVIRELKKKPDLVFAVAPTLFAAPLANLNKKTAPLSWLHIQDFELDAALNLGILQRIPFLEHAARKWEEKVYQHFDVVSTISHAMEKRLQAKNVEKEKIRFFPNWINTQEIFPMQGRNRIREALKINADELVLLYSGSIGQKQGAEGLIEVARLLKDQQKLHFVICGEGPEKSRLVDSSAGMKNVHFMPLQPANLLNELLNAADIHLLPQRAGAADLVMPSKLLGMLASGRPVIATCQSESELYKIVEQVGVATPPEDIKALAEAILSLASDPLLRQSLGSKGREFVCQNFSQRQVLEGFISEVCGLLDKSQVK